MHIPSMKEVMECEKMEVPCRDCPEQAICKAEFSDFLTLLISVFS